MKYALIVLILMSSTPSFGADSIPATKEYCQSIGKSFVHGHKLKSGKQSKDYCRKIKAKKAD